MMPIGRPSSLLAPFILAGMSALTRSATAQIEPQKPTTTVVGLRFDAGYTKRKVLDLPITGADMGVAFGGQPSRAFAIWGATRLMLGSTENGLSVYTWRLGPDFDVVLDRFRIGLGANIFVIGIHRAIRSDTITCWGPALHGGLRMDAFRSTGFALFLRLDGDAGLAGDSSTTYYGATFGAGIDLDVHGARPPAN